MAFFAATSLVWLIGLEGGFGVIYWVFRGKKPAHSTS